MIAIVDYGSGNIQAFANVYKRLNIPAVIARNADDLRVATKIILPGVGAFDRVIECLQSSGMRKTLDELVLRRRLPTLGVCVGMQILARSSEEGKLPGLGWIEGEVKRFDFSRLPGVPRLPHMGWNDVRTAAQGALFQGLETDARFYFLHSYYFQCSRSSDVAATTDYGGAFTSAVGCENIFGVQFHPEKSHHCGIQLLKNFANL
jgi:glutamine amidotransferase